MSNHSRTKGHSFERDSARQFREELGFEDCMTKRQARGGDWEMTDDGIDLVNTEQWAVSCKRYRNYVPISKIDEIKTRKICHCHRNEPPDGFARGIEETNCYHCNKPFDIDQIPLLLTKKDHGETMAVLPWNELKKIIRDAYRA